MSFLPGIAEASSKAYTVLDDIAEAAARGGALIHLLQSLVEAVSEIFHHAGVQPHEVSPKDPPPVRFTEQSPDLFSSPRDVRISRDLQP